MATPISAAERTGRTAVLAMDRDVPLGAIVVIGRTGPQIRLDYQWHYGIRPADARNLS